MYLHRYHMHIFLLLNQISEIHKLEDLLKTHTPIFSSSVKIPREKTKSLNNEQCPVTPQAHFRGEWSDLHVSSAGLRLQPQPVSALTGKSRCEHRPPDATSSAVCTSNSPQSARSLSHHSQRLELTH